MTDPAPELGVRLVRNMIAQTALCSAALILAWLANFNSSVAASPDIGGAL